MAELTLGYQVRSYSSGTRGRALVNARTHHWVADGSGGEAVGAGELFLSGIAACAVTAGTAVVEDTRHIAGPSQFGADGFVREASARGQNQRRKCAGDVCPAQESSGIRAPAQHCGPTRAVI